MSDYTSMPKIKRNFTLSVQLMNYKMITPCSNIGYKTDHSFTMYSLKGQQFHLYFCFFPFIIISIDLVVMSCLI